MRAVALIPWLLQWTREPLLSSNYKAQYSVSLHTNKYELVSHFIDNHILQWFGVVQHLHLLRVCGIHSRGWDCFGNFWSSPTFAISQNWLDLPSTLAIVNATFLARSSTKKHHGRNSTKKSKGQTSCCFPRPLSSSGQHSRMHCSRTSYNSRSICPPLPCWTYLHDLYPWTGTECQTRCG